MMVDDFENSNQELSVKKSHRLWVAFTDYFNN